MASGITPDQRQQAAALFDEVNAESRLRGGDPDFVVDDHEQGPALRVPEISKPRAVARLLGEAGREAGKRVIGNATSRVSKKAPRASHNEQAPVIEQPYDSEEELPDDPVARAYADHKDESALAQLNAMLDATTPGENARQRFDALLKEAEVSAEEIEPLGVAFWDGDDPDGVDLVYITRQFTDAGKKWVTIKGSDNPIPAERIHSFKPLDSSNPLWDQDRLDVETSEPGIDHKRDAVLGRAAELINSGADGDSAVKQALREVVNHVLLSIDPELFTGAEDEFGDPITTTQLRNDLTQAILVSIKKMNAAPSAEPSNSPEPVVATPAPERVATTKPRERGNILTRKRRWIAAGAMALAGAVVAVGVIGPIDTSDDNNSSTTTVEVEEEAEQTTPPEPEVEEETTVIGANTPTDDQETAQNTLGRALILEQFADNGIDITDPEAVEQATADLALYLDRAAANEASQSETVTQAPITEEAPTVSQTEGLSQAEETQTIDNTIESSEDSLADSATTSSSNDSTNQEAPGISPVHEQFVRNGVDVNDPAQLQTATTQFSDYIEQVRAHEEDSAESNVAAVDTEKDRAAYLYGQLAGQHIEISVTKGSTVSEQLVRLANGDSRVAYNVANAMRDAGIDIDNVEADEHIAFTVPG